MINPQLELAQIEARCRSIDPTEPVQRKFHGTSRAVAEIIAREGFKVSKKDKLMFGHGVYLASNSSKSSQDTYAKPDERGYGTLLVCSVYLGKRREVHIWLDKLCFFLSPEVVFFVIFSE